MPPTSGGTPQRSRNRLLLIGAGVVVVAVLAIVGVLVFGSGSGGNSDEAQIRTLVRNFTDLQNKADAPGLMELSCAYNQAHNPATSAMLRGSIDELGTSSTSVTDIRVRGDRATAMITTEFSKAPSETNTAPQSFVKEKGSWKFCSAEAS